LAERWALPHVPLVKAVDFALLKEIQNVIPGRSSGR